MAEEKLASRWLVSTEWLAARLNDPNVVVLDASYYLANHKRDADAEFLAGHIPGAQRFDIDAISDKSNPLPHMLPSPEQFAQQVGALGVGDGMTIVLYDGIGLYGAARVWWTFRAFGSDNVRVLDGGMPKWKAENRPLETGARQAACGENVHAEVQTQHGGLDRRRAEGVARQDRAGRRCAFGRPLPRRGARAAPRHTRRPHAGLLQCPVRRGAQGRPAQVASRRSRPLSARRASISTSRRSQAAARASRPRS